MRLNQVTVTSTDVARSVAFYAGLGLLPIVHSDERYARFACPDGGSTFSVHLGPAPPPGGTGTVVYFETPELDEVVARLKARGYAFDAEPVDQPWLWREAYLRDPDGNVICLFWAGENRLNPPWRLKGT